jgi:hypothetical protein
MEIISNSEQTLYFVMMFKKVKELLLKGDFCGERAYDIADCLEFIQSIIVGLETPTSFEISVLDFLESSQRAFKILISNLSTVFDIFYSSILRSEG